jgi:hypothetical protein
LTLGPARRVLGEPVFDIAFTADTPDQVHDHGDSWSFLPGRITLGDDAEDFRSPLGRWARADYEWQWAEAARRLLGPHACAAFVTQPFRFCWVMWREGEAVFAHEGFLTPERLAGVTEPAGTPYHLIGDRRTHNQEGERISEWRVSAADIRAFLERRVPC